MGIRAGVHNKGSETKTLGMACLCCQKKKKKKNFMQSGYTDFD